MSPRHFEGPDEEDDPPFDEGEMSDSSVGDGMYSIPDPEDTLDPVDATLRLCVRIDPKNPLHEKIYLWVSRLPTDRRGLTNIGAHIVQALNAYLDDAARPASVRLHGSPALGPEGFAARARPAASDRARYREVIRQRQEDLRAQDKASDTVVSEPSPEVARPSEAPSTQAPVNGSSPSAEGVSSPIVAPLPVTESLTTGSGSKSVDYGFLSGASKGDETAW